jgi:TonB family protein
VKSLAVLVLVPIALGVTQTPSSVQAPAASMSPGATQNIEYEIEYENEFLGMTYPLSTEWVREPLQEQTVTGANSQQMTPGVLLAAVHVPATNFPIVDSSLTLRIAPFPAGDGKDCLAGLAASLAARKEGRQQGGIDRKEFAGFDFYRLNVKPSQGRHKYVTVFCTVVKGYALQWIFRAQEMEALEEAAASLKSLTRRDPRPSASGPNPGYLSPTPHAPERVAISKETAQGLSAKDRVEPRYPQQAKYDHIQGTVVFHAVIDSAGNIIALEPLSGPRQLVPASMEAVRHWKYKPYLPQGRPVEVDTTIEVNFAVGG